MATFNIYEIGALLAEAKVELTYDSAGQIYIDDLQNADLGFHRAVKELLVFGTN